MPNSPHVSILNSASAFKTGTPNFSLTITASPRATIFLTLAAKAYALLHGRGYVTPQDVKSTAPDVLRHRVIVSYEAEAEEKSSEEIVAQILDTVEVP